ncbi:hypothetical protein [Clostridium sp. D33t1_170424_F3]|uniref:hypothetical protein n=1 Tax=Clostridium sp. D33t1_170424_F3 TaxID=2787099 RepID=UPI00336A6F57
MIKTRVINWEGRRARLELSHDMYSTEYKLAKKDQERDALIRSVPEGLTRVDGRDMRTDAQTGEDVWYYQNQGYSQPGFCKGVAVDGRGYVYVGVTIWEQEGEVQLAVLDAETGKELSLTPISAIGKVGTNGAAVRKDGDNYLLYLITNYQTNAVYCSDVTGVSAPVPYSGFGVDGGPGHPRPCEIGLRRGNRSGFRRRQQLLSDRQPV